MTNFLLYIIIKINDTWHHHIEIFFMEVFMKIKANKILAVVCVIAMVMTMIVPMTMTASAAGEITASKTVAELISEYGWTSSTTKQSFNLDENVSVKINGGSNTGKAYDGDHIRIYATDTPAGTITISVAEGYELVSIKISTQTGTYAFLYVDGTTTDISNVETAVSGQSVLLNSVKNGSNGKQVRVTAMEVVYRSIGGAVEPEQPACTHENTTEVGTPADATCTEDGITAGVKCADCGEVLEAQEVIEALGHDFVDGVCDVCGEEESEAPTVSAPSEPVKYVFSDYPAGTQYAVDEVHVLDDLLTVTTSLAHFTTQLRLYSSATYNGTAILAAANGVNISGLSFNAGNKVDTLNVYGLADDGWTLIEGVSITSTSYKDYTVNFNGNAFSQIKLDVAGTQQVRVANITVTYSDVQVGDCAHENETEVVEVPATCTENGSYTFVCGDCGETVSKVLYSTGHDYVDNTCTKCGENEFDEYTIEEALAAADGTKVLIRGAVVIEINTPWNSTYGNITATVEDPETGDTLYLYRLSTNVEVGDILTITGTMATYNNARQLAQGGTAEITGKAEVEEPDPIVATVEEALALEDGTLVTVTGVVSEINTAWSDSYENISVTITDANGDELYLYRLSTKVALGDTITVTGKMATYNNARQVAAGSTAVVVKPSVLPQLNAINAYLSVAYKYVEDGTTLSDSQFVLKCGVDAGLANIEGVTAYGIAVTAGNMTVYYTSDTAASWTVGNDVISVAINLGDIINDQDKLGTAFTVRAFVEADGFTYVSEAEKTYSVAGMIDEYTTQGIEEVEHLYNILVGYGLV